MPRDVDPMLASQGFHDLLDEARSVLGNALRGGNLELIQLTGAICSEGPVHRPGLWLVLRETGVTSGAPMSAAARAQASRIIDQLCAHLQLS